MRFDVAVLFVDPKGPYPRLVADWYDEARDATRYAGPLPVVAHPPCGPWGKLKHLSRFQNPAHAVFAVDFVRKWGGVLEHPKGSGAWKTLGLPAPGGFDGFGTTLEVDQCRWGHVARKWTWLYVVGASRIPPIPPPREPTHWICGSRKPRKTGGVCPPDRKFCSSQQRRRTPPAFAEWLLEIAASCKA